MTVSAHHNAASQHVYVRQSHRRYTVEVRGKRVSVVGFVVSELWQTAGLDWRRLTALDVLEHKASEQTIVRLRLQPMTEVTCTPRDWS